MKVLTFTENADYKPEVNHFALAKIDRKKSTCETRLSNDQDLADKYGYSRLCLEEVGNFFQEDCKSIVHYHDDIFGNYTQNIREFLSVIEKSLKIDKKGMVFGTEKTVTALRVSPFWLKNTLRRRLFLILVKDGKSFYKDAGLDKFFENSQYCSKIKDFLKVFLAGYTKFDQSCLDKNYKDFHNGIISQFKNKTEEQIKDVLMFKEH